MRVMLSSPSWWGISRYFCWILGVVPQAFMLHFNCLTCNLPEFSFIHAGCANPPRLTSPLPTRASHWSGRLLFHLESLHRPAQLQRTLLCSLSPHSPFPCQNVSRAEWHLVLRFLWLQRHLCPDALRPYRGSFPALLFPWFLHSSLPAVPISPTCQAPGCF